MRFFQPKVIVATVLALWIPACSDQVALPCGGEVPSFDETEEPSWLELYGPEEPVRSTTLESVCVPVVIRTSTETSEYDSVVVQLNMDDEPVVTNFADSLPTPGSPLVGELHIDLSESPMGRSLVLGEIELTGDVDEPKFSFDLEIERSGDEVKVRLVPGFSYFSF